MTDNLNPVNRRVSFCVTRTVAFFTRFLASHLRTALVRCAITVFYGPLKVVHSRSKTDPKVWLNLDAQVDLASGRELDWNVTKVNSYNSRPSISSTTLKFCPSHAD
eukprot:727255_1